MTMMLIKFTPNSQHLPINLFTKLQNSADDFGLFSPDEYAAVLPIKCEWRISVRGNTRQLHISGVAFEGSDVPVVIDSSLEKCPYMMFWQSKYESSNRFDVKFGYQLRNLGYLIEEGVDEPEEEEGEIDPAAVANLKAELKNATKVLSESKAEITRLEKAMKDAQATTKIIGVELKQAGKVVKKTTGIFHKCFPDLLDLAMERENIFLYGPTGSGKTFIAKQLADSLKMEFGYISCTKGMSEGHLGGRNLPLGPQGQFQYVISEFLKRYEQSGVFLLDEVWASDENVLLFINTALANKECSVPNRPKKPYASRHPDFICIAADNTVGTGSDRLYTGRSKPDMSTLDRFAMGKLFVDYDPNVERVLCPDDELRLRLLKYREAINANGLERCVSMRFLEKAYNMRKNRKWSLDRIDQALFEGWREDEKNKCLSFVSYA